MVALHRLGYKKAVSLSPAKSIWLCQDIPCKHAINFWCLSGVPTVHQPTACPARTLVVLCKMHTHQWKVLGKWNNTESTNGFIIAHMLYNKYGTWCIKSIEHLRANVRLKLFHQIRSCCCCHCRHCHRRCFCCCLLLLRLLFEGDIFPLKKPSAPFVELKKKIIWLYNAESWEVNSFDLYSLEHRAPVRQIQPQIKAT